MISCRVLSALVIRGTCAGEEGFVENKMNHGDTEDTEDTELHGEKGSIGYLELSIERNRAVMTHIPPFLRALRVSVVHFILNTTSLLVSGKGWYKYK
jgi:hypothetical protein